MPITGADPVDIACWQRLAPGITTSGMLGPDDPARLAAIGIRHVINLALDDHPAALAEEAELLAKAGVEYTHIPIPFDAPTQAHYEAFTAVLDAAEGPVHVHCIMNWRVSALFYRRHCEHGMPEAEARALMQRQWDPLASNDPRAEPWARLIAAP